LRGPEAFRRALRGRYRRTGRWFAVTARPNELPHGRLGMIVARRVAARAVERNRLKRQIREVYRRLAPELGHLDVVVQVQAHPPQPAELPAARAELTQLLLAVVR
jgi:ribonuclease P protein component